MTNFETAMKNYQRGLWTDNMLETLVNKSKLTLDEYKEIVGSIPTSADLDVLKANKIIESKEMLEVYLLENPLTWVDGNTYSVTMEKQSLLTSQLALYKSVTELNQEYPLTWNTTGGECTEWTYDNLLALALAIGAYVKPLVAYQQSIEIAINNTTTVEELDSIVIDYSSVVNS